MSILGYAEKLSYRDDVGTVGMSEIFDPPHVFQNKIKKLADMIEESKHLVVFTGAGISTSCGIPDFRGPGGVWTLKAEGKSVPEASLPFHRAMPSRTHMALAELMKTGVLKFVISQNIDSLHLRSGIPRDKLAELHGNSFMEICPSCGAEYLRDFPVETIGMKKTPRLCSNLKCGKRLKDTVIDWENKLPAKEMDPAEEHCRNADVVLCLGTSLQIAPACKLPSKSLRGGGKIVIVNLQRTPEDKKAGLVIHGQVDKVIAGLMHHLNLQIPPYVRIDLLQITVTQISSVSVKKYVKWNLRVASVHGERAPLPFIESVEVSFPDRPKLKKAVLQKQPFTMKRETLRTRPLQIVLKLNFSNGCACQCTNIEFPINFEAPADSIVNDKEVVIEKLRKAAIQDQCCGQLSLLERKNSSTPIKETTVYAIATNIVQYNTASNGLSEGIRSRCPLVKRQNNVLLSGTDTPLKKLKVY